MVACNPKGAFLKIDDRLRWSRIAIMALAIGLPVSLAALVPLARQALEERRRSALEARYEDGLSPCHSFQLDDYQLLRDELPRAGVSAMMVFPSFSDPYAIAVSGDAAYYLQMDLVRNVNVPGEGFVCGNASPPPTVLVAGRPAQVTPLPAPLLERVRLVLDGDVRNARAELPLGLDGTNYVFRTPDGQCAQAWSPRAGTRADALVSMFHALGARATGKRTSAPAYEQKLEALLERLE